MVTPQPGATVGWARGTWVLRTLVAVLPVAALLVAPSPWPPTWLVLLVAVCSLRWGWAPDDVAGVVALLLVGGWWAANGAADGGGDGGADWRLGVVGALLVAAHVAATVASYGPGTLAPDPSLVRVWVRRAALAAVPLLVALGAVQVLDADHAPRGLWTLALATVVGLVLVAARATQRVRA